MRTKERLRLALQAAELGTWSWEAGAAEGSLDWDDRCRALHDAPYQMAVNRDVWAALIRPEDRPGVIAELARALDPTEPQDEICCTYRVTIPGGVRWLRAMGRAFFEQERHAPAGRRAVRMMGTIHDVTAAQEAEVERIQAAAALADSEARFRDTFDQAAVGIAHVGLGGTWLRVNGRLCAMLGYSEAELLALSFQDITHPDDLDADLAYVRQVLGGEIASYSMEKRYIRKDGAVLWIELTVSLCHDAEGAPLHFISVVQDIAGRKAAEVARWQSEARLRLATTGTGIGTWELDLVADRGEWSPEAAALLGIDRLDGTGESWADSIHPADRAGAAEAWRRAVEDEAPYDATFRAAAPAPEGGERWLISRARIERGPAGRPLRGLGVLIDLTASKQAEARLRLSEARRYEAERTLQQMARRVTIAAMASGIAHELNQPLGAASNYLGTAVRLFGGPDGHPLDPAGRARMVRMLDRAGSQILRAGSVLQRLKDFLGSREPRRAAEPVSEVVREAVEMVLLGTPEAGLQAPVVTADPAVGLAVLDRVQIQQVVVNLVRNAIEAMRDQPGLREQCLTVSVGLNAESQVEVSVTDTGPGMPPENAARLFETFHSSKPGGMGVGLSICRAIVEAHGGRITARPVPGGGMTFAFTLPRLADGEAAAKPMEMSA
ncbi:PAS domain S-box protein [Paracraurococcus ruber]|uniref:histidine kinase n=1 Tax=Paracraurococcus ruber TaxID=77675 RepID=A0ABS1D2T0_9PROT|nr:PAS domain S-box protein [Paracraurococcus ruber]MBK1660856.1 hypothetical protein [Paracraurococcus ruber]TDG27035.1 PAS domain S-box protein [Paracraurococcus ruber]